MSWRDLLGLAPREDGRMRLLDDDGLADDAGLARVAVEAAPVPPSAAAKRSAADHVARFERAMAACETAIAHGEADDAELAALERWRNYFQALASFEAGKPDSGGN